MHTIVIGVGYTGQRVLDRLPAGEATGIRRAELDLDLEDPHIPELPDDYAVLYTVPPRSDADGDLRLATLLGLLHPPPGRIVYLSTTGVYGNRDGDTVSESDTPAPATARASRRLAAETMLREWCAERDTEFVILRVPGIYGPGRVGLERIGAGEPVIVESEAGPGNRIHVDDLATCCIRALSADAPAGIYNVGDGDHRSGTAFTKAVARIAGLPEPPEITMAEAARRFSPMRLSFLKESRIVDTTRMQDTLGCVPRYGDPEDGIRASLEEA